MTKTEMAAAIEALQRVVVRLQADVERLKNPWAQPLYNFNYQMQLQQLAQNSRDILTCKEMLGGAKT